jgi:23S rRNA-/tRNA-specific pseudouridylate synthase
MTSSGIERATFRLVTLRLHQLRYRVPHYINSVIYNRKYVSNYQHIKTHTEFVDILTIRNLNFTFLTPMGH